eukprot:g5056.t1
MKLTWPCLGLAAVFAAITAVAERAAAVSETGTRGLTAATTILHDGDSSTAQTRNGDPDRADLTDFQKLFLQVNGDYHHDDHTSAGRLASRSSSFAVASKSSSPAAKPLNILFAATYGTELGAATDGMKWLAAESKLYKVAFMFSAAEFLHQKDGSVDWNPQKWVESSPSDNGWLADHQGDGTDSGPHPHDARDVPKGCPSFADRAYFQDPKEVLKTSAKGGSLERKQVAPKKLKELKKAGVHLIPYRVHAKCGNTEKPTATMYADYIKKTIFDDEPIDLVVVDLLHWHQITPYVGVNMMDNFFVPLGAKGAVHWVGNWRVPSWGSWVTLTGGESWVPWAFPDQWNPHGPHHIPLLVAHFLPEFQTTNGVMPRLLPTDASEPKDTDDKFFLGLAEDVEASLLGHDHGRLFVYESDFAPQPDIFKAFSPIGTLRGKYQFSFLTHGGAGSVAEAVGFGIPMLCLPFAYDQPQNCGAVARLGMAIHLGYLGMGMVAVGMMRPLGPLEWTIKDSIGGFHTYSDYKAGALVKPAKEKDGSKPGSFYQREGGVQKLSGFFEDQKVKDAVGTITAPVWIDPKKLQLPDTFIDAKMVARSLSALIQTASAVPVLRDAAKNLLKQGNKGGTTSVKNEGAANNRAQQIRKRLADKFNEDANQLEDMAVKFTHTESTLNQIVGIGDSAGGVQTQGGGS